jgi:hypothetical protein
MQQLRIYTLNRGALEQFVTEWRTSIVPVRQQAGFEVLGGWSVPATNQFVWLLSYTGPGDWDSADRAYFDSPERRAMSPNPARLIARIEQYFVNPA